MQHFRLHSRNLPRLTTGVFLVWALVGCVPPPPTTVPAGQVELPTQVSLESNATPVTATTSEPEATASIGFAPGAVVLNQAINLSAVQSGDVYLEFEATQGQVLRVDLTLLGGTPQYEFNLVDKYGNSLATIDSDPAQGAEAISEITLPFDGTYRLAFAPMQGNGTVKAVATALGLPSSGGVFDSLPVSAGGIMSAVSEYHMYQFPLQAGDTVTVAARANIQGMPDVRLALIGVDGRITSIVDDVADPTDFDAVLPEFVAPETGIYTAIVSNYGDATGAYIFSVTSDTEVPAAEGPPDLNYDQTYRAAFGDQSTLSATFDGTIGDVIRIDVREPASQVDLDIYLFSPFEQVIAYAVDRSAGEGETLAEMQLPYTGRYRIELRPLGSGEASFVITHLASDALTGGGSFGAENSGTRSGIFDSSNVFHVYQLEAAAGDKITLSVNTPANSSALDLGLAVLGPSGHELVFGDDSSDSLNPLLDGYVVNQTGTYTVIVYSFYGQNGSYDIAFSRN